MASINWKNSIGGDWLVGAAWSTGSVPASLDDATIDATDAYVITLTNPQSVISLSLNAAGATLTVMSTLNLGSMFAVTAGAAVLTTSGAISGGKVRDTGANAQMHLSGPTTLDNATLNIGNQDRVSHMITDADVIRIAGSASLTNAGNAPGGMLTVSDGARVAGITMTDSYTAGMFHLTSDGNGGSLITYG